MDWKELLAGTAMSVRELGRWRYHQSFAGEADHACAQVGIPTTKAHSAEAGTGERDRNAAIILVVLLLLVLVALPAQRSNRTPVPRRSHRSTSCRVIPPSRWRQSKAGR